MSNPQNEGKKDGSKEKHGDRYLKNGEDSNSRASGSLWY